MKEYKKKVNRRDFLKIAAASAAATPAFYGCSPNGKGGLEGNASSVPAGEMTYRTFPDTGDTVSLLGYGCMRWPTIPSADGAGDRVDQEAVNRLVDYAIAHGVNYFDTSPVYVQGWSEKATGIALKKHPRDKIFIATKLSNFRDHTRQSGLDMYYKSLADLQTDYIDYYLLHSIGGGGVEAFNKRYVENGLLDFLLKERQAGRIRKLGFSFHGTIDVFDYLLSIHRDIRWDFVQIQLNYLDWENAGQANVNAGYLYAELAKLNIPSVIMEPLLGGRLSNIPDYLVSRYKQRDPESSVASWAFRFAGSHRLVLTVLSGMTYMEHLQDNIRTYSPLAPLNDGERAFLAEMAELILQYPTIPCNDCKYCMPCPYGIDIPGILLHYNKCVNEGNMPQRQGDENYGKARRIFLTGYDRSVPKLRQASYCIGCKECNPACPQWINIPEELQRIDRFVEQLKQHT
jgi:predicted aldo/keto reductase-like oxidoreductase